MILVPYMTTLQKQIVFWTGLVFVVVLGVFVAVSTNQALNTAATTNTVSFSGEGKVTAKPDIAIIDLSIVTEAPTSKAAQDQNSAKSRALTDFLKGRDIDDKDIKTTGYNIYPQYNYPPYGRPTITGYQVNQTIQIRVRDLAEADTVLDGVVSSGVNQINNFQLAIDDPEKLRDQAREEAIKDAKEKADKLEDQLGIRLGRIVNFSEGGSGSPPIIYAKEFDGRGGVGGGGPSVPTGESEIIITVTITYQIK